MKTMKYLSMLLMLVVMSVCMVGCGDDDDESGDDSIVGTWVVTGSSTNITTYQFKNDGTGVLTNNSGSKNFKYTYSVVSESKNLQLWYVNSTIVENYSVQKTGNTLMLTSRNSVTILERK